MYGIPNMKLDKQEVVLRRLALLEQEGIQFVCNTEIGKNYPVEKLQKDFDAVILAIGATQPRDLPIEGRPLQGIHFAVDFLSANTRNLLDGLKPGTEISAAGKNVIIIGGGDTGTDCAGTSIRHGCKSVTQLEIMPQPALERAKNNPWPEWPKTLKTDYGQEEAIAKFGADPRLYLTTATKFEGDARGHVQAVHTVQVEWTKNDKGQFIPKHVAGTEKVLPAQLVLIAMGFLGPQAALPEALHVERNSRSNIQADFEKYTTNVKGIFACGDCRRGQSLVVWAFNEGRGAARECDRFLTGHTDLP
jgi:glutamate synthase (NADPH/NADH) small chain